MKELIVLGLAALALKALTSNEEEKERKEKESTPAPTYDYYNDSSTLLDRTLAAHPTYSSRYYNFRECEHGDNAELCDDCGRCVTCHGEGDLSTVSRPLCEYCGYYD